MAAIYLAHPKHGVKIATMEMEAQYDEANGWVRFDPDEPVSDPANDPANDPLPEPLVEANVMAAPRRRGRARLTQGE